MGAATVTPTKLPSLIDIIVIVAIAWGFHMTFYGFNDVADFHLDRLLGRKDDHPLVRGDMSRRTALIIAAAHTAGVFIIEALSGTTLQLMLLLMIACGGVIIYDVFSKRNSFPPLTDAIESIGFIALALYGATKVGTPNFLSYMLAITFGLFINFITGIILGIADVEGDLKGNALTTPIWFGIRPMENTGLPWIPRSFTIFGLLQIFALVLINCIPLIRNEFGYSPVLLALITSVVVLLFIAIFKHTIPFIVFGPIWQKKPKESELDVIAAYSVLILIVSYFFYLSTSWLILLGVCVLTPLVISKSIK